MPDKSHLDQQYFVDFQVYNCAFCNRRNLKYSLDKVAQFDWTDEKQCWIYLVRCSSCRHCSMHLSFSEIHRTVAARGGSLYMFNQSEIDKEIFYSVPSSFFTLDERIPRKVRELVSEAEGCMKMNYLTGASACTRKAIYELLAEHKERISGNDYESKIKALKGEYPGVLGDLFDALSHIQSLSSDTVHEDSWEAWDSNRIKLMLETLKTVLHEIYVRPKELQESLTPVKKLKELFETNQNDKQDARDAGHTDGSDDDAT